MPKDSSVFAVHEIFPVKQDMEYQYCKTGAEKLVSKLHGEYLSS